MTIERFAISDRASWLAMRSVDLTASDIGAAIGVDPFKTQLALYAEKTGMLLPNADNVMTRRGRWLEPAVIEAILDKHPDWQIERAKVYLRDTELRLGATPDAVAQTDKPGLTNIQLKVIAKPEFDKRWAGGPPLNYVLQTLAEGLLLDASQSLLAALVIDTYGAELFMAEVPRHAAAEARVMEIAASFWENVRTGRRPAADLDNDHETLAAIYPQSKAEPVLDLTGDNLLPDRLAERARLKAEIDVAETAIKNIDTEIKDKLGEAEKAILPGWKISLKTQHRKAMTLAACSFRRLRVTKTEEANA